MSPKVASERVLHCGYHEQKDKWLGFGGVDIPSRCIQAYTGILDRKIEEYTV